MGAFSYTVNYEFDSKEKVSAAWERLCEEDAYESGSGAYSGNATTMGKNVRFNDKRFSCQEDAYQWVIKNHQKWDDPLAASFYLPKEPVKKDLEKIKRAKQKLMEEELKKVEWMNKQVQLFIGGASQLVGCKGCGSKLNRKSFSNLKFTSLGNQSIYSNGTYHTSWGRLPICPLCNHSLLSNSANAKLEKLNNQIEKAKKVLDDAQRPRPSKKIGWVVGGWAAC